MIQCNTLFKIERKNVYEMLCTKRVHDKSVNVQRRLASPLDYEHNSCCVLHDDDQNSLPRISASLCAVFDFACSETRSTSRSFNFAHVVLCKRR